MSKKRIGFGMSSDSEGTIHLNLSIPETSMGAVRKAMAPHVTYLVTYAKLKMPEHAEQLDRLNVLFGSTDGEAS